MSQQNQLDPAKLNAIMLAQRAGDSAICSRSIFARAAILFASVILASYPGHAGQPGKVFDGRWWMGADYSERSGFIDGFSDCAVWSAHEYSFNTTPEQIVDRITTRLQLHKEELGKSVIDAWKAEARTIKAPKKPTAGSETWSNPHWYLNLGWWRGENLELHGAYVEGYLLCIRTLLPEGNERYSRPADEYIKNIDAYVTAHKFANKVSVASILQRFQDTNRKAIN